MLIMLPALNTGCGLKTPAPKPEVRLVADQVTIEGQLVGAMTVEEASRVLINVAKAKDVPAVNAGFAPETGEVIPERLGQRLNVSATLNELLAAAPGSKVAPVYQHFAPDITQDKLARSHRLGCYATQILDDSPGRLTNIRLTAKLINNTVLESGQEFSFNRLTGEPTASRGFQPAAVFGDKGKTEQGLGGGMCQVSSTLYNAVLAANLTVTERHPHSQPVNYVPPGKDATTYTDKDFRFINTTRHRLISRVFTDETGSQLTVELWGLPDV
ncbi:VanW family protein [Sporomusa ovata]|nr:VanW family protein [Sporomusa ovata]